MKLDDNFLDQYFLFSDGPDADRVLALPKVLAEILFSAEFEACESPELTYADYQARVAELDADDLIYRAETLVIERSFLTGETTN